MHTNASVDDYIQGNHKNDIDMAFRYSGTICVLDVLKRGSDNLASFRAAEFTFSVLDFALDWRR